MFDTRLIGQAFGNAATSYDEQAVLQKHVRSHCLTLARRYFPAEASVLDVGCGTGAMAREADMTGWTISGIDLSPGMCAAARNHMKNVVVCDASNIPMPGIAVDSIFSSLMLQWANEPASVLAEMARVLKPGGYAVIATLAAGTLHELAEAFKAVDDSPHISPFMEAHQLLALVREAGFVFHYARQVKLCEYYADSIALMRALKEIGAGNKHRARRKSLMTPKQFAAVESTYAQLRTPRGLPATWQVLYLVIQKP